MPARQANRFLRLHTVLGDDALVVRRANSSDELGRLPELRVEFSANRPELDKDSLLGSPACLHIRMAGQQERSRATHTRHWHGHFRRVALAGLDREGRPVYHATLVPWLWFLTRTSDCRIFQNRSVPEILETLFRDAGFSDFESRLSASYQPREYRVQYQETDFDFASRLMEHEGIYYYFKHRDGSHRLILCDSLDAHQPARDFQRLPFVGGSDYIGQEARVTDWAHSTEVRPGAFAHNDFNFLTPAPDPNLRLLARSSRSAGHQHSDAEIYENAGTHMSPDEGERYARIRMQELIADRETVRGRANCHGLRAGKRFDLEDYPTRSENRGYLLTKVEWSAAEAGYGSGAASEGDFFDCRFTAIPDDTVFRPARNTRRPRVDGPQTATVVGPPDQEIHIDEHSRVKVQFHWDRLGRSDAGSSCWIRVSQPWAGRGFGGLAIPRIGHEVIVQFIEGDPDRPIITGRVYNGLNGPIVSNAGRDGKPGNVKPSDVRQAAMMTSIKSNSLGGSGGHNEITMNDTAGAEGLYIRAQKDEIHLVLHDREDTVGNNETRSVGDNRSRQVGSNETVNVGANRTVTVGANHQETIGANQTITVGACCTETIGGAKILSVGAAYQVTVGASMSETVGGAKATAVGAAHVETVGGNREMSSGKKITLTASDEIELVTGAAKIVLKKSGRIEVVGVHVSMLSGAGIVEIDAGGIVNIKGPMVKINT